MCIVTSLVAGGKVTRHDDPIKSKASETKESHKLRNASHAHYNYTDVIGDMEKMELEIADVREKMPKESGEAAKKSVSGNAYNTTTIVDYGPSH